MRTATFLFLLSAFAFFSTAQAGTWDTFEMGYVNPEDKTKCFSSKHKTEMIKNFEYQVPNKCATMVCHDSYIVAERTLEVGKKYNSIGACGTLTCDDKAKLEVEQCPAKDPDSSCTLSEVDLTHPYPECCPTCK